MSENNHTDLESKNSLDNILDQIQAQPAFQEIKSKWDQLEPEEQYWTKIALLIIFTLSIAFFCFNSVRKTSKMRAELSATQSSLALVEKANQELVGSGASGAYTSLRGANATRAIQNAIQAAGIKPERAQVSPGRPGKSYGSVEETLIDVTLTKVNIKHMIELGKMIETSSAFAKLRHLHVDTKENPDGWMDAKLAISYYALNEVEPKGK